MTTREDQLRTLLADRALLARATNIQPRPDPDVPAPLSAAQARLWFAWRYEPASPTYIVSVTLRFSGAMDEPAMLGAVRDLAERHQVLRSVISERDGEPVAVPMPADSVPLSVADIAADELANALRSRAFKLDSEPPMRAVLYRLGPKDRVLALSFHHIAIDGWSHGLIVDELAALYAARLGTGPAPERPRLQYADFAAWERQQPEDAADLDWWSEQLAGLPTVLDLPYDRRRPPVADFTAAEVPLSIPDSVAALVGAQARALGCTEFMILLAAWQALLSRLSGMDDIAAGVPAAGRQHRDAEAIVGCFVNTLAVRTDLSDDPAGRELISQVRDRVLDAFEHSQAPFERVVERLRHRRSTAATAVVQVLFNMLEQQPPGAGFPGLTVSELPGQYRALQFDLSLDLRGAANGYTGVLAYRTDLLDTPTATRWARWYATLLEHLVTDPDTRLSTIDILSAAERAELLAVGQGSALPVERLTVPQAILAQASRTPDAIAVADGDGELSYRELVEYSGQVAEAILAASGGQADHAELAGVSVPRDRYLPAVLLGVWRAGMGYVPLEPDLPAERMEWIARDAGVGLVLTRGGEAPFTSVPSLDLDNPPVHSGSVAGSATDLAYVLYTSGSTGRPKGVEVTHSALAAFVAGIRQRPGVDQDDVSLALAPLSFDALGAEIWPVLTLGGRCVVVDRDSARDGRALADRIAAAGATMMVSTPTTLRMLLAGGWAGDPRLRVWCGGEPLEAGLAWELIGRVGQLWNVYGPTEATIITTVCRVPADVVREGAIPIGSPLAGVRTYVVDRHGRLAPQGVTGELWLGGPGLARGYRHRPELTGRSFVDDPFRAGDRCYRTGDLVRMRTDGSIEFLGRRDHQVKVRGYRIELGEVEAAILGHPAVGQAAATVAGTGADTHLVGYVTPSTVDTNELEAYLRQRLPGYLVPRRWMLLDALPVQPSGKVDRTALPEPERGNAFVAPRTEAELLVAEVWQVVLGIDKVGAADDFFVLGGHSFAATRVAGRLTQALELPIPVRLLFDRSVLADLATEIERLLLAELGG